MVAVVRAAWQWQTERHACSNEKDFQVSSFMLAWGQQFARLLHLALVRPKARVEARPGVVLNDYFGI